MNKVRTIISIKYARGHTKVKKFEDNLLPFLINECHNKAEIVRRKLEQGEIQLNITQFGAYVMSQNRIFIDRSAMEMVRIVDAMKIEKLYIEEQVREHHKMVNITVRNIFYSGSTAAFLKCMAFVNHYALRH